MIEFYRVKYGVCSVIYYFARKIFNLQELLIKEVVAAGPLQDQIVWTYPLYYSFSSDNRIFCPYAHDSATFLDTLLIVLVRNIAKILLTVYMRQTQLPINNQLTII